MCSRMNNKFDERPKAISWRSLFDNYNINAYRVILNGERDRERNIFRMLIKFKKWREKS